MSPLVLIAILVTIGFGIACSLAFKYIRDRKEDLRSRAKYLSDKEEKYKEEVAQSQKDFDHLRKELAQERDELDHYYTTKQKEFERLLNQARELRDELDRGILYGRKWLAKAFAEFVLTRDTEIECSLVIKPNPAWTAAETVAELRKKRMEMAQSLKLMEYQLASYEEYFPFLIDYKDAILNEVVNVHTEGLEAFEDADPALTLGYLSKEEYDQLSTSEKFQLALDRYWERKKSNIEIGRLYERYIGYLYEKEGWIVRYQGILKGYEDFGRDLICKRNGEVNIIQCKCWSQNKIIREKHIMQLFGTVVLYRITEHNSSVKPVFTTTTSLSEEAKEVARELGITIRNQKLDRYPMIKCNINPGTNERIYHLPFDQQYDRVIIGDQQGEFYAESIKEAEIAGFRRAYRWRGDGK